MNNPQTITDLQHIAAGRKVPKSRLEEHARAGLIILDLAEKPTLTVAGNNQLRGK